MSQPPSLLELFAQARGAAEAWFADHPDLDVPHDYLTNSESDLAGNELHTLASAVFAPYRDADPPTRRAAVEAILAAHPGTWWLPPCGSRSPETLVDAVLDTLETEVAEMLYEWADDRHDEPDRKPGRWTAVDYRTGEWWPS